MKGVRVFRPDKRRLYSKNEMRRPSALPKHNRVCRMYETGSEIEEIAEETGYTVSTVKQLLSRYGLYEFDKSYDKLNEMMAMREEGRTLKEISEATGYHCSTVSKALVRKGKRKCADFGEPEIDKSKLTYAEKPKPPRTVIVNGKRYVDMTDVLYDTDDIMSL